MKVVRIVFRSFRDAAVSEELQWVRVDLEGVSTVSIEKQKVHISVAILQRGGSLAANL